MASAALATFFGASCSFVPHCSTPNQPVMSLQWSVECSPSFFNLFEVGGKERRGGLELASGTPCQKLLLQSQGPKRGSILASTKKPARPLSLAPNHCRAEEWLSPEFGKLLTG